MSEVTRNTTAPAERIDALRARISELEDELQALTEQKDAESVHVLSENRYRALLEAPFEGIIISEQGRILDANQVAAEMFGYTRAEFQGKHVEELTAEQSRSHVLEHVASGTEPVFIHKAIRKNGTTFDAEIRRKAMRYRGRNVRVVAVRDVTARVETEAALRHSEAKYRSVVMNIPHAAWTSDEKGRAKFVTPHIVSICGYQPEEFYNQDDSLWLRNLHPDDAERVRRALDALFGHTRRLDVEYRFLHKDGHWVWLHDSAVATREPDGTLRADGVCSDVTERKEAEAALRESQRTLSTLMSNLPGMAYRCVNDKNWTMEFVSEGCVELTGYPSDALIGSSEIAYADLIHPDDRDDVWRDVQHGVSRREPFTLNYRIRASDGTEKWVWQQGRGVFDDAGRLKALEGFITDNTSSKLAEESLRKGQEELEKNVQERTADLTLANARLLEQIQERERAETELRESTRQIAALAEQRRVLLQDTSDFLYRHDVHGVFNYVSPSIEQMTGYSAEEWSRHYPTYMTDSIINAHVAEFTDEAIRTGQQAPPFLVEIRHKNGELLTLELNEKPYFEDGKAAGVVGVGRDVTQRFAAERALRESEERLQAILDNAGVVIYTKDLNEKYVLINKRHEDLFGVERGSVVGKTDFDLFPRATALAFRKNDRLVIESGKSIEFEESVPQDDGMHTYISLKFLLYDSAGEPYALCGISTDITERKKAETALLEAKNAAEKANRAKSVFLANLSHEIRTPIAAMLGAAEVMAAADAAAPGDQHRIGMILRNGRHLLSLINELLDLSRAEAGQLEIVRSKCSLLEILADAFAATDPLHDGRAVKSRLLFDGRIPTHIHTDATRLKQALINLIGNALKFTEKGHVFVRVSIQRETSKPMLIVAVEDTGVGIAEKDLERVFDVFAQVESAARTVASGVGLGLPLVRWIAEQLGGDVSVTSELGVGSRFVLRVETGLLTDVDFVDAEVATVSARATAIETGAFTKNVRLKGRVLLAEDFDDVRDVMTIALKDAGAEVVAVEDGRRAVSEASNGDFDLILLDIRMAPMDGITAVRELRRLGCLTPIIAVTASAADSDRKRILEAGFDDHWAKPLPLEELVSRAEEYLDTEPGAASSSGKPAIHVPNEKHELALAAIASEFVASLPQRLDDLQSAIADGDRQSAIDILHQLAGAGGLHGQMKVSEEAGRLLKEVRAGRLVGKAEELARLTDLVRQANERTASRGSAADKT